MRKYLVLGLLAVSACASPGRWERPGGDAAALDRDRKACLHEAQLALAGQDPFTYVARGQPIVEGCLEAKGYALVQGRGS